MGQEGHARGSVLGFQIFGLDSRFRAFCGSWLRGFEVQTQAQLIHCFRSGWSELPDSVHPYPVWVCSLN